MRGKIVWGSVWQLSSGTEEGGGSLLFVWCQCECGSDQWNTVCSTSSCVFQGLSQTFPPSAASVQCICGVVVTAEADTQPVS